MGRTEKNIKLKKPEKPRKIKGFRLGGYRIATTISSQPRYDHFDTSPDIKNYDDSIHVIQVSVNEIFYRGIGNHRKRGRMAKL